MICVQCRTRYPDELQVLSGRCPACRVYRYKPVRPTLAYRLRTWLRWYLCVRWNRHRWTPWEPLGWTAHYRDDEKVFEGHVYSRRCTWCGKLATKDA